MLKIFLLYSWYHFQAAKEININLINDKYEFDNLEEVDWNNSD